MSKLAISVILDITLSDDLDPSPPYDSLYGVSSEIESIISDGCDSKGFSYVRVASGTETHVADDFADYIYEITENP